VLPSADSLDKVHSTLRQFVRDWADEGEVRMCCLFCMGVLFSMVVLFLLVCFVCLFVVLVFFVCDWVVLLGCVCFCICFVVFVCYFFSFDCCFVCD
jgi:hypothetical protein